MGSHRLQKFVAVEFSNDKAFQKKLANLLSLELLEL